MVWKVVPESKIIVECDIDCSDSMLELLSLFSIRFRIKIRPVSFRQLVRKNNEEYLCHQSIEEMESASTWGLIILISYLHLLPL